MRRIILCFFVLGLLSGSVMAKNIDIGVAWVGGSTEANLYYQNFTRALKKIAPQIKVEVRKNLPSYIALRNQVRIWEKQKQGVVLIRSRTARWLLLAKTTLPTFLGLVNNPSFLGIIKNIKAPEGNVTGATYYVPVAKQFALFKQILPNMKSVLLLHQTDHPSTVIDSALTAKVCSGMGIKLYEADAITSDDLVAAINKYQGKVSAIIIGNHALGIHATTKIVKAAGKTPVFSYLLRPIMHGVLAGLSAHVGRTSAELAQSVVDVLVRGKAIKDVPVKMDKNPQVYINVATAKRLGIEIPSELLDKAIIVGATPKKPFCGCS